MATLLLTTLGSAFGGPVGGLLGAIAGQQIDQRLFGPKGRQGPRLADLAVQSSTYGTPVPALFGTTRVSGTVIWATDLVETRKKVSNGKGQPKTKVYAYTANFAVLVSARPIIRIGRIWADGKLLRGAAGDFKTETQFRLYTGSEDQSSDPLIAAVEGLSEAPAYRGRAYAVFEGFALEAYGNRIPSLSFEVIADEGAVPVGAIVAALSPAIAVEGATRAVGGYPAGGTSLRSILANLAEVVPLRLVRSETGLSLQELGTEALPVATDDLGASAENDTRVRQSFDRKTGTLRHSIVALRYHDSDRDYQPGLQRAVRSGGTRVEDRFDFPATLSPADARRLAESMASDRAAASERGEVSLLWRRLDIVAGQNVEIEGLTGMWRVRGRRFERMVLHLVLERLPDSVPSRLASPGRVLSEADLPHGPTHLELLDLPPLGDSSLSTPLVAVAAAGVSPGWRRAALLTSTDSGANWNEAGATAPPAIMGTAQTVLAEGPATLADDVSSVEVTLLNTAMTLHDADTAALLAGENSAMLGTEMLQFGKALMIAPGRYLLSHLWRGRRGTEWAIPNHQAGESFVLLDPDSLAFLPAPLQAGFMVMAVGLQDAVPPIASLPSCGAALTPLTPAQLKSTGLPGSDMVISWVRRSRAGWSWADHVDVPLSEESERYRLTLTPNAGLSREHEAATPSWTYTATEQAADQGAGATFVAITVQQVGTYAVSRAANLTITLN